VEADDGGNEDRKLMTSDFENRSGKGATFTGCGKTKFAAALKGRDFQSRRKKPDKLTAAFSRRIECRTPEEHFPIQQNCSYHHEYPALHAGYSW
jgi:hypothetical protein